MTDRRREGRADREVMTPSAKAPLAHTHDGTAYHAIPIQNPLILGLPPTLLADIGAAGIVNALCFSGNINGGN